MNTGIPIMAELLQLALEDQWSGQKNVSCHCHPEYVSCCPQCDVKEGGGSHTPDCTRSKTIRAARAFLQVENELAEERGEETVYVP